MVRQFAMPIDIIAADTVRTLGGLALSSRNGYLDDAKRVEAAQLQRVLREVVLGARAAQGEPTALDPRAARERCELLERDAMSQLESRGWSPDYVAIRRQRDLGDVVPGEPLVVLGAARLGDTRLIDNVEG